MNKFFQFLLIISLSFIHTVYAQQTYQVSYHNEEMSIAELNIGGDCFEMSSVLGTIVKAKNDSSMFRYYEKPDGKIWAMKVVNNNAMEFTLFQQENPKYYFKIDTLISDQDTLIDNITCRKVFINYVQPYQNENKVILPYDTIKTTLFVASEIKTFTPFSFVANHLSGLIVGFRRDHPQYSAEYSGIKKSFLTTIITAKIMKVGPINDNFFKLPESAILTTDEDEYYQD